MDGKLSRIIVTREMAAVIFGMVFGTGSFAICLSTLKDIPQRGTEVPMTTGIIAAIFFIGLIWGVGARLHRSIPNDTPPGQIIAQLLVGFALCIGGFVYVEMREQISKMPLAHILIGCGLLLVCRAMTPAVDASNLVEAEIAPAGNLFQFKTRVELCRHLLAYRRQLNKRVFAFWAVSMISLGCLFFYGKSNRVNNGADILLVMTLVIGGLALANKVKKASPDDYGLICNSCRQSVTDIDNTAFKFGCCPKCHVRLFAA